MSIGSLGYLGLKVKEPRAFTEYATGILGLMAGAVVGEARRFRLDELDWRLSAEQGAADDVSFLGFEVAGPTGLDTLRERLAKARAAVGGRNPGAIAGRGARGLVRCRGPAGP